MSCLACGGFVKARYRRKKRPVFRCVVCRLIHIPKIKARDLAVKSVEYCQRDKIAGGEWREWTDAQVRNLVTREIIYLRMPGYFAERHQYPSVIAAALKQIHHREPLRLVS